MCNDYSASFSSSLFIEPREIRKKREGKNKKPKRKNKKPKRKNKKPKRKNKKPKRNETEEVQYGSVDLKRQRVNVRMGETFSEKAQIQSDPGRNDQAERGERREREKENDPQSCKCERKSEVSESILVLKVNCSLEEKRKLMKRKNDGE